MPKHTDVLIVGGGLIGSYVAYWLRMESPSLNVTVVERDSSVKKKLFYSSSIELILKLSLILNLLFI